MIIRAIQITSWCFLSALMIVILWLVARGELSVEHPTIEYKDFVAILLTAIGVMIAIAAVVAALGAIWGFGVLRAEVKKAATEAARKETRKIVPGLVAEAVEFGKQGRETQADKVAEEYGKEGGNDGAR